MRLVSILACGTAILMAIAACGSSTSDDGGSSGSIRPEGGSVDARYCDNYCDAQANAGTLQGSRADCIAQCCKDVPDGCPSASDDGGTNAQDSGNPDAPLPGDSGVDAPMNECTTGADCTSGCCAPATNAAGDPVGPYICKPNDGKDYDCCSGITVNCTSPACCGTDTNGNEFCARPCTANAMCGTAKCEGFSFNTLSIDCHGQKLACGP